MLSRLLLLLACGALASVPALAAGDVMLAKLEGVVVVDDPKQVVAEGLSGVSGVRIKGPAVLEQAELKEKLASYLGRPLTKESKAGLVADIVRFMRRQGKPLVNVTTPPQEITGGVLQVLVLEGEVGEIRVKGGRWFGSVADRIRPQKGAALDLEALREDLDWVNRNPFRSVDLVYAKSAELGKTDLVFRQTDRFPLRVYTGYEDSGTALTGHDRWLAGLNWGSVFGTEGIFSYQFLTDPSNFRRFRVHSGSYAHPLPWRHVVTAYYSRVDTRVDIPPFFKLLGFSWQTGVRYEVPLPRLGGYKHAATAGFDFKRANNALAFGGTQVFDKTTEVAEWSLGYNSSLGDRLGRTTLRVALFASPGAWTGNNSRESFSASRAGAEARYAYAKVEVNRTTRLPCDFALVNLLTFQKASANLLGSEQLGFGGYDTIRGYDSRVLNTDEGYLLSNELRAPAFGVLSRLPKGARVSDRLQLLAFADYGVGSNKHLLANERNATVLFGAGPGLRYTIAPYLTVRADYGWQLRDAEARRRVASRWHLAASASF